jgi:alpha-L-rhamnosidase
MKNQFLIFVLTFCCSCNLQNSNTNREGAYPVSIDKLRCEYLENPVGIDIPKPRLSWILVSTLRGQGQTAYRILVASSREMLAKDAADLWDSGKINSDRSIHIEYDGLPLKSRQECYWKVRVWDKDGKPSEWSRFASWSMGLLNTSDWGGAGWISYFDPSLPSAADRHFGYQSWIGKSAGDTKWVAVDLGQVREIDSVKLYPVKPYNPPDKPYGATGWHPNKAGYLFPLRFRIEVSGNADFSDAVTVVDHTGADVPSPGDEIQVYRFKPVQGRHVRLTVTRLVHRHRGLFGFALAEMEVYSGSDNIAKSGKVTSLDSVSEGGWSTNKLVDGRLVGEPGLIDREDRPATMVRKEFELQGKIKRASVSVTGLGLYELYINGHKVGDHLLAPEWTQYTKRIQYQTYDVTDLLNKGLNAVGAQIAGGWWTGPLAVESPLEDPKFCLLMRMDIELKDGSTRVVVTDSTWHATTDGPIRQSGIYYGERYDALREMPGWDMPGFNSENWLPVKVLEYPDGARDALLVAQCNEPIRVVEELQPVSLTEPEPRVYVFDMGQNMVGWCSLTADASAGTRITVRHAEKLKPDGTLYTDNLRGAAQINDYVWGGGKATREPHFTYHGFRFVEVRGLPEKPDKDAIVGKVFHSSAPVSGNFECSNELINSIMHNIKWGQKGNMPSVPTDCPQRTERLGFLGDMQSFSQTAIFTMDMAGFFTKWINDMRDSQTEEGRFPVLAPHPASTYLFSFIDGEYAPGWGDAGTIVPWGMYVNYADKRLIEEHYESARRWIDFILKYNPDFVWREKNNNNDGPGDWLNGDMTDLQDYPRGISRTPHDLFASAFFAHSTEIVSKMAKVLGKEEDAGKYSEVFKNIKSAFNREFVSPDGKIKGNTQGGYALALSFDLVDESTRKKMISHLLDAIERYNNHLSTGFMATHRLMLELSDNGQHDEAWRLVNLRTVPSWGYMVEMGATTIWERWDGYVEGRGYQHWRMNSFNHFAFGSVGEWVWRELVGLNPVEEFPGYKHFMIKPRPGEGLTWVKGSYQSIYGTIVCDWKIEQGQFNLNLTVPPNTTATIYLPASEISAVFENGKPVTQSADIKFNRMEDKYAVFDVSSGIYSYATNFK